MSVSPARSLPVSRFRSYLMGGLVVVAVIAVTTAIGLKSPSTNHLAAGISIPPVAEKAVAAATEPEREGVISFPQAGWTGAGIELGDVVQAPLRDVARVTGKITLNEDRVAHISPLVAGRVEKVHVPLGQHVKAGDVLVTVESPEIGNAKLGLYRNRLLNQFARVKDEWTQEVARNTHELVESLRGNPTMEDLASGFREKKLGKNREQLIAAYTNLKKARVDRDRLETLSQQGITPGKELIAAKAIHDAELANFQAMLETIDQEEHYNALLSTHARQEAETRVAVDEASLKLLGFQQADLDSVDPVKEGKGLSRYQIVAPFDGTIIAKDVALLERVTPEHQVMTVADLSSVWIKVDVFEQHLALLSALEGGAIEITAAAWPGETFKARVFHTGEIVDEASRTIGMRAMADNPDGRLKPGMFVEVALPGTANMASAVVPATAIQEHQGKSLVFVHLGGDRFEVREVRVGRGQGGRREVVSGLKEGEKVVVKGGFALKSRMLADLLSGD